MRSCITQVRSPFIKRVLLNTATCEPLPKIPGLLSHNPKAGAWDCIFDKLARDWYAYSSLTTIVAVAGPKEKDPALSILDWAWREKNLLFQISCKVLHQTHRPTIRLRKTLQIWDVVVTTFVKPSNPNVLSVKVYPLLPTLQKTTVTFGLQPHLQCINRLGTEAISYFIGPLLFLDHCNY